MKPIIGITGSNLGSFLPKLNLGNEQQKEEYKFLFNGSELIEKMYNFNHSIQFAFENDIEVIEDAGGIPFIIPASNNGSNIESILEKVDGIYITGGHDVNPKHYNEVDQFSKGLLGSIDCLEDKNAGLFAKFSEFRDFTDINLVQKAYSKKIPILGICRGIQVINVAFGGSVYQDILKQEVSENNHSDISNWNSFSHSINIEKDSMLFEFLKKDKLNVNSIHHQSIKDVGNNLKVVAKAQDGIIECIESTDDQFLLGIQWHPEMLRHNSEHNSIFSHFIKHCKKSI